MNWNGLKLPDKPYFQDDAVVIYHANCRDILPLIPDKSIDLVLTDPPYGLGFMNKEWDNPNKERELIEREKRRSEQRFKEGKSPTTAPFTQSVRPGLPIKGAKEGRWFQEWCYQWALECLQTLKPGGYLLSFGATRTYHRMACAIEDAGFEIRDMIEWIYGSGFPKSLDVSKAIDKKAGAERKIMGRSQHYCAGRKQYTKGDWGMNSLGGDKETDFVTASATSEAKQWDGWGTALKPAHEPIVLARKPLSEKTVAENVLKWGTGAINIDASRVKYQSEQDKANALVGDAFKRKDTSDKGWSRPWMDDKDKVNRINIEAKARAQQGRFPANLIHDGSDEVLAEFPTTKSGDLLPGHKQGSGRTSFQHMNNGNVIQRPYGGDSGSAARFFYCAKASRAERDAGLDGIEAMRIEGRDEGQDERNVPYKNRPAPQRNQHPTVKPLALMRYLIKLITPPNGIILDPFMGSGSTVLAAKQLGFKCIGIEISEEYCHIAAKRCSQSVMRLEI